MEERLRDPGATGIAKVVTLDGKIMLAIAISRFSILRSVANAVRSISRVGVDGGR